MDEIKKILRAVINGQSALKQELLGEIKKLENKFHKRFDSLEEKVDGNTKRLDKIGSQVAYLEDDAPTREDHENLEKRVEKVESKNASL